MPDRKPPDDRELDDFLAGRSELSQRYRDAKPREAAPPELDQLVLDRARQAVQPRVRRGKFVVPLALAASVVLTFSVVLMVREETGGSPLPPPTIARDNKVSAPAAVAVPAPAAASAEGRVRHEADLQDRRQDERKKESAPQRKAESVAQPSEPAPPRNAMEATGGAAVRMAPSAARAKLADDDAKPSSPAQLDEVRKLKDEGRIDDARRKLVEYRDANPDAEIPEDLRSLVAPPP